MPRHSSSSLKSRTLTGKRTDRWRASSTSWPAISPPSGVRLHSNETPIDPELLLRTVEGRQSETDVGADEAQTHRKSVQRRFDRRKEALAEQVEKLPPEQQTILSAFAEAQKGEPWAARHARRTGDDPNRVRVRLHRLIAKLRKEISRRLDDRV